MQTYQASVFNMENEFLKKITERFNAMRWPRVPRPVESFSIPKKKSKKRQSAAIKGKCKNKLTRSASEVADSGSISSIYSNGGSNLCPEWSEDSDESITNSIEKMRRAPSFSIDNIVAIPSELLDYNCLDADEFFVQNIPVAVSTPVHAEKPILDHMSEDSIPFENIMDEGFTVEETAANAFLTTEDYINACDFQARLKVSVFSPTMTPEASEEQSEVILKPESKKYSDNSDKTFHREMSVCEPVFVFPSPWWNSDNTTKMKKKKLSKRLSEFQATSTHIGTPAKLKKKSKKLLESMKPKNLNSTLDGSKRSLDSSEKKAKVIPIMNIPKNVKNIPICHITTTIQNWVLSPYSNKCSKRSKGELEHIEIDFQAGLKVSVFSHTMTPEASEEQSEEILKPESKKYSDNSGKNVHHEISVCEPVGVFPSRCRRSDDTTKMRKKKLSKRSSEFQATSTHIVTPAKLKKKSKKLLERLKPKNLNSTLDASKRSLDSFENNAKAHEKPTASTELLHSECQKSNATNVIERQQVRRSFSKFEETSSYTETPIKIKKKDEKLLKKWKTKSTDCTSEASKGPLGCSDNNAKTHETPTASSTEFSTQCRKSNSVDRVERQQLLGSLSKFEETSSYTGTPIKVKKKSKQLLKKWKTKSSDCTSETSKGPVDSSENNADTIPIMNIPKNVKNIPICHITTTVQNWVLSPFSHKCSKLSKEELERIEIDVLTRV